MSVRQRQPRERDSRYLSWIRQQPCVRCAWAGVVTTMCEAAHVKIAIAAHDWREGGVQEKSDDRRAVPLCARCHREAPWAQHRVGERNFWRLMNICPGCLCAALVEAHDAGDRGDGPIWGAVRSARSAPTEHL